MEIASKFDFTGNPVTRISMKGVAEKGTLVDAKIYLDDDPDPVCTVQLDNRSRSGGWNTGEMSTVYVYDEDIKGEHKVSIGFDIAGKSDDQEAGILLREIEFVEDSGIPTLYFNDIEDEEGPLQDQSQGQSCRKRQLQTDDEDRDSEGQSKVSR